MFPTIPNDALNAKLFKAVEQGDLEACQVLLGEGADPNSMHSTFSGYMLPLMVAVKKERVDIVHALLEYGANPNDGEFLHEAVRNCDLDCARVLLKFEADANGALYDLFSPNVSSFSPIPFAIALSMTNDGSDRFDMIDLLFSNGGNVEKAVKQASFPTPEFVEHLERLIRAKEAKELKKLISEQLMPVMPPDIKPATETKPCQVKARAKSRQRAM